MTVTATQMVMATVMRVVGDKERKGGKAMGMAIRVACNKVGNVDSGKSAGNEGGRRATAARAMVKVTSTTWAWRQQRS